MFRKKKLEAARVVLHDALMAMPRLNGGSTVTSGKTKSLFSCLDAFAKVHKLKGLIREELGDRGFMELTYTYSGTLSLEIAFSCGENDDMYALIREIFYENQEGLFDGYAEEDLVYKNIRVFRVREDQTARIEYEAYNVKLEELDTRVDRMLDHVNNELDIFHEAVDEECGE